MAKNLLVVSLLLCFFAASHANEYEDLKCFKDLKPKAPNTVLQGSGGTIEVWDGKTFPAMKDANVAAGRLVLKPGALLLPAYVDIPAIKVVVQGSLTAGIINPMQTGNGQENVHQLQQYDAVALPPGVATWWYNGGNQDAIVFCVGDTKSSPEPGAEKVFLLSGGKGKVLKGFSTKFLAQAWEASETDVKKILTNQQDSGIIQVPNGIRLELDFHIDDVTQGTAAAPSVQDQDQGQNQNKDKFTFVYPYPQTPDIKVERGGEIRELNSMKMQILKYVGMGYESVTLEKGAMIAPNWFHNSHQVVYVEGGNGKLQIVDNMGERVLDVDLKIGDAIVVPKDYPSTVIAGAGGLNFVSVLTTHTPIVSFLAGNNSVYSAMPAEVVSAAFKLDQATSKLLQQTGSQAFVIVPPKQGRRH